MASKERLMELLGRTAMRDRQAFEELYRLTGAKLNGVAFRILNNADSANEVLQEAYIQIWRRAEEYRVDLSEPMTWMSSIVRYRAYDRVRAENRRFSGTGEVLLEPDDLSSEHSDPMATCSLRQELADCLKTLEKKQRHVVLLAYYKGYSRDELAMKCGAPINTVKSWLRRGLMRLQTCLRD